MANAAQLGPGNFQSAVGRLAPMGLVWPSKGGGVFQGFWNAVAGTLAAFHAREGILTEIEAFPPTSVELLPDWEEVLGLPDPCLGSNPVTAARQSAVRARLAASGGQSVPYYIGVAADLGATIAITEYAPWRWGVDAYWSAWRNASWAYVWLVTLTSEASFSFQWGISAYWEPWWQIANDPVQCELQRLAPAHTQVDFTL